MQKFLLAIASIALLVIAVAADNEPYFCGTKPAPFCANNGENCTGPRARCSDGYCAYFNDNNSTCLPFVTLNGKCDYDEQCKNQDIGEAVCWNSTCQAITFKAKLHEACSDLHQCKAGLYCNNINTATRNPGVCVDYQKEGEICDLSRSCDLTLGCSFDKCVKLFSIPAGGACDDFSEDFSFVCKPNLICQQLNETNGVCTALNFTSSKQACNFTIPVCSNPMEQCTCVDEETVCMAPQVITSSQAKKFTSFQSCTKKCENINDPYCCIKESCTALEITYPGYNTYDYEREFQCKSFVDEEPWKCKGTKEVSKAGVIVGVLVGVAVVAAIVAFIFWRRRNYRRFDK